MQCYKCFITIVYSEKIHWFNTNQACIFKYLFLVIFIYRNKPIYLCIYIYTHICIYTTCKIFEKTTSDLISLAFSNDLSTPVAYVQTRLSLISSLDTNRFSKRLSISFNDHLDRRKEIVLNTLPNVRSL